jgi:hypothetical protein
VEVTQTIMTGIAEKVALAKIVLAAG